MLDRVVFGVLLFFFLCILSFALWGMGRHAGQRPSGQTEEITVYVTDADTAEYEMRRAIRRARRKGLCVRAVLFGTDRELMQMVCALSREYVRFSWDVRGETISDGTEKGKDKTGKE